MPIRGSKSRVLGIFFANLCPLTEKHGCSQNPGLTLNEQPKPGAELKPCKGKSQLLYIISVLIYKVGVLET